MVTRKCVTVTVKEKPLAVFDLVSVTADKIGYVVGDKAIVTVEIKNIGNAPGRVNFKVGFTTAGCYMNMSPDWVDSIEPGVTHTKTYTFTLVDTDVGTASISVEIGG